MGAGELASVAIIAMCVWGVVLASRARRDDLTAQGVRYWTPVQTAIVAIAAAGLIGLVALHWLLAALGPEVVQ